MYIHKALKKWLYLDTLLIDYTPEGWQELGDEEKSKVLNDVNDTVFNNRLKMKQSADGRYYRELKNTPAAADKTSGADGYKFAAQYTDAQINKMVSNMIGKVEKAETVNITDLLNISSGMEALSGPKYNVDVTSKGNNITITESLPGDNVDKTDVYDISNASSLTNLILRTQFEVGGNKNKVKAREIANAIINKQ